MTTTHTPGPWFLSDEDSPLLSGADGAYIAQVFSRTNCDIGSLRSNYAADARLIASAPELLDALQGLIGSLAKLKSGDYVVGRDSVWLDAARAAIARATA